MIGEHDLAPVTIFVVDCVEGDGVNVDRVSIHSLYATREAAEAFREARRGWGPYPLREFQLTDDGRYVPVGA